MHCWIRILGNCVDRLLSKLSNVTPAAPYSPFGRIYFQNVIIRHGYMYLITVISPIARSHNVFFFLLLFFFFFFVLLLLLMARCSTFAPASRSMHYMMVAKRTFTKFDNCRSKRQQTEEKKKSKSKNKKALCVKRTQIGRSLSGCVMTFAI